MNEPHSEALERKSGIAIWRQIADQLRHKIAVGGFGNEERLPSEMSLAQTFCVNRHTVRAALNALAKEGIVESKQGQGTFVRRAKRIDYPIGKRTRFSDGVSQQSQSTSGKLLTHRIEPANEATAAALGLALGANVICMETLNDADGVPLSRATSWFCAKRFADLAAHYGRTGSITQSLKHCGVADYVRASTIIQAHHASMEDAESLQLSPGAIVIITVAINHDLTANPIQYSKTRFAADRISLSIQSF